ncbi:hypothetical protein [Micromonospora sp. NPDC005161]
MTITPARLRAAAARHIVPLPAGMDPVDAAPLTDAGLTPYRQMRDGTLDGRAVIVP